ncbi:MAG TPA: Stp1/IreP family PP2C-type Ser/Thr phosphatase [Gemmatimonadota bacterium]|nr:Stp1/IreP family PP2C-type Ser/Thr phosphatase [Gemmatimonadota bacterium]
MPPTTTFAAATDVGRVREQNEDAWTAVPGAGLYAVADGMGGHAAGEVASRLAIEALEEGVDGRAADTVAAAREALAEAVRGAARRIHEQAREHPERRGMGTTLTAMLLLPGGRGVVAHVGDSRAYSMRDERLGRLTRDHTWVQARVDSGELTEDEARRHPASSVLTRALGADGGAEPDLFEIEWRAGDVYLLCSDGLTAAVGEPELEAELGRALREADDLEGAAGELVREANRRGGPDNVTVILVRPGERPPQ